MNRKNRRPETQEFIPCMGRSIAPVYPTDSIIYIAYFTTFLADDRSLITRHGCKPGIDEYLGVRSTCLHVAMRPGFSRIDVGVLCNRFIVAEPCRMLSTNLTSLVGQDHQTLRGNGWNFVMAYCCCVRVLFARWFLVPHCIYLPSRNSNCGKVIFSQASVSHSAQGVVGHRSREVEYKIPTLWLPPGTPTPGIPGPQDTYPTSTDI